MVGFSGSESDENHETSIRRRSDFDKRFSISPKGSINRYEYVELSNSKCSNLIEALGSLDRGDTLCSVVSVTCDMCICG